MRHLLILTLVLMFTASLAFAQAGSIGIFADLTGNDCNLVDNASALFSYNVVYVLHAGGSAVQFAAPKPDCLIGTWLSDTAVFSINLGTSQTGVSIGFPTCQNAPTHVLTVNYFLSGATAECCYYKVVPHPLSDPLAVTATNCSFIDVYPTGGEAIVNSNPVTCDCDVPAHESTWGKVKALYAN